LAKPVASLAFLWTALASGALDTGYGVRILLGLVLCMAGDLLLIPKGRPAVFRAGVIAFLLGHVAYSMAFLTRPLNGWGVAASAALLVVAMTFIWRWLAKSLPADMVRSVQAYLVVISVMSALACGVSVAGGPVAVAAGALAFTASDVSVARDRFVRHEFVNRAWGLPLYYAAQILLALTPAWVTV
jgi:uncharacterized membrane protein YhhN